MNISVAPPWYVRLYAPAVVGNDVEPVTPPTSTLPDGSTWWLVMASKPVLPSKVDATNALPVGLSLVRKPSPLPPLLVREYAPGVVGKLADVVTPETYALPAKSTAIEVPKKILICGGAGPVDGFRTASAPPPPR